MKKQPRLESALRDRNEAIEQHRATAEVLRVIAKSGDDTDAAFHAITSACKRLLGAHRVALLLKKGDEIHYLSHSGATVAYRAKMARFYPRPLDRTTVAGKAIITRNVVHVPDATRMSKGFPKGAQIAKTMGYRTLLAVPLIARGAAIGTLNVSRLRARPFAKEEIVMAKTFAD